MRGCFPPLRRGRYDLSRIGPTAGRALTSVDKWITRERTMTAFGWQLGVAGLCALVAMAGPAAAADTPKRGGTLTFMIPADAPPTFDGHRETTYATVHTAAPFYSVLIRVNPDDPASTTDFVCDLCTEMPQPTGGGKIYTFKIRNGVKFHDGSPLTAADVAKSW